MVGMTTFDTRLLTIVRRQAWCTRYNVAAVVAATRGIVRLFIMADIALMRSGLMGMGSQMGGKFYCPHGKKSYRRNLLDFEAKKIGFDKIFDKIYVDKIFLVILGSQGSSYHEILTKK